MTLACWTASAPAFPLKSNSEVPVAGWFARHVFVRSPQTSCAQPTVAGGVTVSSNAISRNSLRIPQVDSRKMSSVALSLKVEVAFVVCHHIARVFIVIAGASAAFGYSANRSYSE